MQRFSRQQKEIHEISLNLHEARWDRVSQKPRRSRGHPIVASSRPIMRGALRGTMKATQEDYREALEQVCTSIIATEAARVDRGGVFPEKSIGALKGAGLLGAVSS